jgi:superfamily II DNA or RNA helicase
MSAVVITKYNNLLEVSPACELILGDTLTYNRVEQVFVPGRGEKRTVRPVALYKVKGDKLITTRGAMERIVARLRACGITDISLCDLTPPTLKPDYENVARVLPSLKLRYKQGDIIATIAAHQSSQLVAPTAYGKTFIITLTALLYPTANIIVATPSRALLNSISRRLSEITGQVGVVGGGKCLHDRITVTTYKSLLRAPIDKCDILLLDECHRLPASETAVAVAQVTRPEKIVGLTATAEGRSDNAMLVAEVLAGPVRLVVDYEESANQGIVSKIDVIRCKGDYGCPSTTRRLRFAKMRVTYWQNRERNVTLVNGWREAVRRVGKEDPQSLFLVQTVEHALALKQLLPDFDLVYASMSPQKVQTFKSRGLLPDDFVPIRPKELSQKLADFESGKLRRVIATGCWGEGVDFVYLDIVVNASGAASPIATIQWAGRASRINSDKSVGVVVDCDDASDPWAAGRARSRFREYKAKGWDIIKLGEVMKEEEDPAKGLFIFGAG